jgi:hypothetical protein
MPIEKVGIIEVYSQSNCKVLVKDGKAVECSSQSSRSNRLAAWPCKARAKS